MYNQLYEYFESILFSSQCGFWKRYSAQHCLLVMIEKIKKVIDRGNEFGALLTDLFKAFDCINHPLLIAKLHSYRVLLLSINMIFSYLSNRTHWTKINECFSERSRIEHGVPQGSILGPLLFNIDLIDLFYECEESNIASYADDTTPYSCARDTQTVISELKSLANFFTSSSIIILKPILEIAIYFWVPKLRLIYLLVMLQLKLAQKQHYLESWLTQNSLLTNMFLPFVVKLTRNYMF